MAAKIFCLLALFVVVATAENECNCDPPSVDDNKDVWAYLKRLSSDTEVTDNEDLRAVLPGVLSALLECNCLEKNRRKRKVMPEVKADVPEKQDSEETEEDNDYVRQKKSINFKTRRCPQGTIWVGIKCVREEYLE